jgi:hypothetical protein
MNSTNLDFLDTIEPVTAYTDGYLLSLNLGTPWFEDKIQIRVVCKYLYHHCDLRARACRCLSAWSHHHPQLLHTPDFFFYFGPFVINIREMNPTKTFFQDLALSVTSVCLMRLMKELCYVHWYDLTWVLNWLIWITLACRVVCPSCLTS